MAGDAWVALHLPSIGKLTRKGGYRRLRKAPLVRCKRGIGGLEGMVGRLMRGWDGAGLRMRWHEDGGQEGKGINTGLSSRTNAVLFAIILNSTAPKPLRTHLRKNFPSVHQFLYVTPIPMNLHPP